MPAPEPLTIQQLRDLVRDIPDFPKPGILFRDITPLLSHSEALHTAVALLASPFDEIDVVVAIESRGFILGAPVALELGAGLVPVRKVGRLPYETIRADYELEYGTNTLEMHVDAVRPGQRVLIVDDLLATGGTVAAAISLVAELGGEIAGVSVLAELGFLSGRDRIPGVEIHSLIVY
ncbi:MAG: adenine phosphoribosyltransferase [Thermomicrobiales bacterium]